MSLATALGVSRIARVTGLDRAGVEVACAIRPGGHVLQVTNGKGFTAAAAARGALREAAELWCAERVEPALLRWGSAAALRAAGVLALSAAELGGTAADDAPLAWREGRDLLTGEAVQVPAAAVHVPAPGGPLLGVTGLRWTSNGMGAHPAWGAALLHALLEAAERDGLARVLPQGWTEGAIGARSVSPAALATMAPRAAACAAAMGRRGLEARLFDLTPEPGAGASALPLAGALLFDRAGGPQPLTAGYACRLAPGPAIEAALLEAAQSRLTDIHGAREDVEHGEARVGAERLWAACGRLTAPPSSRSATLPGEGRARSAPGRGRAGAGPLRSLPAVAARRRPRLDREEEERERALRTVLDALSHAHLGPVVALDLAPPWLGVRVARVVAPGLLLSELLG